MPTTLIAAAATILVGCYCLYQCVRLLRRREFDYPI